jgi:superfamily I DNA/RNA helicase
MELSWTRRCPISHVQNVNKVFPHINFHVMPEQKNSGNIEDTTYDNFLNNAVCDGDSNPFVLCPQNAPLVGAAFSLLKRGQRVQILGRSFADTLIKFVEKLKARSVPDALKKVESWRAKELKRLNDAAKAAKRDPSESQINKVDDQADCAIAILSESSSVEDFRNRVNSIFADQDEAGNRRGLITMSTVHKAKGMESTNVYILQPELFTCRKGAQAWEVQQMENLYYVAITRSLNALTFVSKPSPKNGAKTPTDVPSETPTETEPKPAKPSRKRKARS